MTDEMAAAMAEDAEPVADRIEKIRAAVARWRDLSARIADLEERLEGAKRDRTDVERVALPEMFAESGIDRVSLPASGNLPAVEARLGDFYRASIPVSWPQSQREEAFSTLERLGLEDLIKPTVTVTFGREELEEARRMVEVLRRECGSRVSMTQQVNHQSLTAAVRELCQGGASPSRADLDKIGAVVGKIVRVKT